MLLGTISLLRKELTKLINPFSISPLIQSSQPRPPSIPHRHSFAINLDIPPPVVEEALRAARRVNDYSTAVRIFEGLSKSRTSPSSSFHTKDNRLIRYGLCIVEEKTENAAQYSQYVQETKPLREELGILLKEELYTK